jgi:hypothetical protein
MNWAKLRLGIALVLFLGWMAYLGWMALEYGKPDIVSRSQLVVATDVIVAELKTNEVGEILPDIKVDSILRGEHVKTDSELTLLNSTKARLPGGKKFPGPGKYLLPLVIDHSGTKIAPAPPSPGFEGETILIYPWNPSVENQWRTYDSPEGK